LLSKRCALKSLCIASVPYCFRGLTSWTRLPNGRRNLWTPSKSSKGRLQKFCTKCTGTLASFHPSTLYLTDRYRYVAGLDCDICLLTDYDRMKLFKFHTSGNPKAITAEMFPFSPFGDLQDSPLYIAAAVTFSKLLQALRRQGFQISTSVPAAPSLTRAYLELLGNPRRPQVCAGGRFGLH
jgi:hypothetical protein